MNVGGTGNISLFRSESIIAATPVSAEIDMGGIIAVSVVEVERYVAVLVLKMHENNR